MKADKNQFKIKFKNFNLEIARGIIHDILNLMDANEIRIGRNTIKKERESIDFSTIVAIGKITIDSLPSVIMLYTWYIGHRSKEDGGFKFDRKGNNILSPRLEKLRGGTSGNPCREVYIETPMVSLLMRNGTIEQIKEMSLPVPTSVANKNTGRQKLRNAQMFGKNGERMMPMQFTVSTVVLNLNETGGW